MLYFAYGSNLHPNRLEARIGPCGEGILAVLRKFRLTFNKRGIDGSGKCNIEQTGLDDDYVVGVLNDISPNQLQKLDEWEATTCGYERINFSVECDSRTIEAVSFRAREEFVDDRLLPFCWYKNFVTVGATHYRFPVEYMRKLEMQPAIKDDDLARMQTNTMLISKLSTDNFPDR